MAETTSSMVKTSNTPDTEKFEAAVAAYGRHLLDYKQARGFGVLSFQHWTQKLMDKMMQNEAFRVSALRFTDVAPTLRDSGEFMSHLHSYFGDVGGMDAFLGSKFAQNSLVGSVVAPVARQNIRSLASTFIAGETIDDGIKTFKALHKKGIACSIDLLGEAVISKQEAEAFTQAYHDAIKQISQAAAKWPEATYPEADSLGSIPRANVSVKLSALYEHINPAAHDHAVEVLTKRLSALMVTAVEHNTYIHIDTEQWELVPITLDVFRNVLMDERFKDYPHVGIVCQAYLRESEQFLQNLISLAEQRGTPFSVRLVKGAYWDYEEAYAEQMNWPCPVFDNKEDTDINYEKLLRQMLEAFPKIRPLVGSHNARSLAVAMAIQDELGLDNKDVEFQVLNGMAESLRDALRDKGYRVRQYCPVGEFIPGMSYLVRRLLENTANQSFIVQKEQDNIDHDTLLKKPESPAKVAPYREKGFANHPLRDFSDAAHRHSAEDALTDMAAQLPLAVTPVISGEEVRDGKETRQLCPWQTDKAVSHVTLAGVADAENALEAAKAAQEKWRDMGFEKRADIIDKAADIMADNWQELFALQVYEAGKDWHSADADIAEAIDFLRFYAHEARTLEERFQPPSVWGEENTLYYDPKGVALVIAPWNFPLAISTGMTGANLVAGNPVLYKPAEQTSGIGKQMFEALIEAGVPADVLHFLPAEGSSVGARLVSHPDVSMITFTGSKAVGLKILEEAGKVHEEQGQDFVKKCVIEMGGKNATIVDSDADLDEAVPGVVHAAFGFQGQKCSATSRVIVVGSAYETFTQRLAEMVEGLRVGGADNPKYEANAVIDKEAFTKINSYIELGREEGTLLAQAKKAKGTGWFIPPVVFTDLPDDSRLIREEIFGPVLVVQKAESIEQAVKMALEPDYRLTGACYSRNPETIDYVRRNFRVGNLYINRGSTGALVARQPFGGGGLSGTGTKTGSKDYLLNFVEPRSVTENTMRRGFAPKNEPITLQETKGI